jgi:signal transduction histidine kinase
LFGVRELNVAIELWGVVFCAIGIASAVLLTRTESRYRGLLIGMFTCVFVMAGGDALAGIFRAQVSGFAWIMTHVGNLATFVGAFTLLAFLTRYIDVRIGEIGGSDLHRWVVAVAATSAVMSVLALLGVFYSIDDANVYHRSDWYWLSQAFGLAVSAVNAVLLWRWRKGLGGSAFACLLFLAVMPALSSAIQAFVYGVNLNMLACVVGTVVVFMEMQRHSSATLMRQNEELAAARIEASESRIAVMVSQIQPHFLFNTLDTIYGLVDEDTDRAKEAIASFSRYLRANLSSLKQSQPVPIEREMEHVRTYLELERMSDEGRLEYELDMQATGFNVPALSVQTLVENAVKHGVGGSEQGGTVYVRTREQATEFTVAVIDDGVGFDVEEAQSAEGIGLSNTRARLAAMCGGTLDATSALGVGTTVVMHIPKDIKGKER